MADILTHPTTPTHPNHVTTDATLTRDLVASLVAIGRAAPAGHTWGSIKAAVEKLGVKDDDWIGSIEFGCKRTGSGAITVDDGETGLEVREL